MARASKLTQEEKDEIVRLHNEYNLPPAALAVRFNVSPVTIRRICDPEYYERQKESNRRYRAENKDQIAAQRKGKSRGYYFSFHVENDAELIDFLDKQENTQDYIRQKVLDDIRKQKKKNKKKKGPES